MTTELTQKLENIISGHSINEDDADWLRALTQRPAAQEVAAFSTRVQAFNNGYSRGYQAGRASLPAPQQATAGALANAWGEGYAMGVADERTSEANIGVAGFGAKVNPARQNPYRTQQATPEPVGEPVAWRWMPSHVFPTWVYSDDQNRVADARRFMGDGGVQALYTRPAPGVPEDVRAALEFYASGNHFVRADADAWETVSGEPPNFWEDEANTATVEDGTIARNALAALAAAQAQGGEHE